MSLNGHKQAREPLPKQAHKKIQDVFPLEPRVEEEFDFKELFERLVREGDWTDKVLSGLGKARRKIQPPGEDTRLSEELKILVPDMKEVKKAYFEMTNGYKDFIRTVLQAKRQLHGDE